MIRRRSENRSASLFVCNAGSFCVFCAWCFSATLSASCSLSVPWLRLPVPPRSSQAVLSTCSCFFLHAPTPLDAEVGPSRCCASCLSHKMRSVTPQSSGPLPRCVTPHRLLFVRASLITPPSATVASSAAISRLHTPRARLRRQASRCDWSRLRAWIKICRPANRSSSDPSRSGSDGRGSLPVDGPQLPVRAPEQPRRLLRAAQARPQHAA